jgi:hypothetical protein
MRSHLRVGTGLMKAGRLLEEAEAVVIRCNDSFEKMTDAAGMLDSAYTSVNAHGDGLDSMCYLGPASDANLLLAGQDGHCEHVEPLSSHHQSSANSTNPCATTSCSSPTPRSAYVSFQIRLI